jgi:hypothetical protein
MSLNKRILSAVGLSMLLGTAFSAGATTAGTVGTMKPVIAKPIAAPAQPVAGKRFTVTHKVTRSDTGKPLTTGRMVCDPSAAGKLVPHAESFKGGTARLSLVVPQSAKALKVKLTIRTPGQSTTRITNYKVAAVAMPSLSIADARVVEGNSGTATLSFPVTLSAKSTQTVSVDYASADGTATAPTDYAVAGGTLSFKPGETAKTVAVTVVGDSVYEPDETLTVALAKPVNATVTDGSATGTITNDDPALRSGHYAGTTSQGKPIGFDVSSDLKSVANVTFGFDLNCSEVQGFTLSDTLRILAALTINPDGTFGLSDTYTDPDYKETFDFSGKLTPPGSASGMFKLAIELYDIPGVGTVHCQTGATPVSWNAS